MTVYDEIVAISEGLEKVRREIVPTMGKADTIEGETLRAFDRIVYRWFNDGDKYTDQKPPRALEWEDDEDEIEAEWYASMYGDGYFTVRPSVVWLSEHAHSKAVRLAAYRISVFLLPNDKKYEGLLLELARAIKEVDWNKRTPCHTDSRTVA